MAPTAFDEPILEPDLPIIDPHHHLYVTDPDTRYLFDELLADVTSGHDIRATVFVDSRAMYRREGPEALRLVGEVEFANGAAAMAASGTFGDVLICAGIVGGVELARGDAIEEVLLAQIAAGNGRFRGVRTLALSADPSVMATTTPPDWLARPEVRAGVSRLAPLGLSLDVTVFETEIPEVRDLARAFPGTTVVLNHVGFPLASGRYAGRRDELFPLWRERIRDLAECENVVVKLGGLGVPFAGFDWIGATPPAPSEQLAADWRPYIETCIEAFGVNRSMFESNYPADAGAGPYPLIWNAFKRIAADASPEEKTALFSGTAARTYRLDLATAVRPA